MQYQCQLAPFLDRAILIGSPRCILKKYRQLNNKRENKMFLTDQLSGLRKNELLTKSLLFFKILGTLDEEGYEKFELRLDERILNAVDDFHVMDYFQRKMLEEIEDDFTDGRLLSCNSKLTQLGY